jgi:hypothetical protein
MGVIISAKSPKTIEWPVSDWICSGTCAEKKMPKLLAIKFAKKDFKK